MPPGAPGRVRLNPAAEGTSRGTPDPGRGPRQLLLRAGRRHAGYEIKFLLRLRRPGVLDMFNLWNRSNFLFATSINEQGSSIFLGSLWGRSQTPLPTFRSVRLSDGSINKNGIISSLPFQLQVAVKYSF